MGESVLARVPIDHLNSDGRPMTGSDWKLHAVIDPNAVHERGFRRRPGARIRGELLAGGGESGGTGGANRGMNPSLCDPRLICGH